MSGSFKSRGALNWIQSLSNPNQEVVACQANNHAYALAWAARASGHPITVFLSNEASSFSVEKLKQLSAQVVRSENPIDECVSYVNEKKALLYNPTSSIEVLMGYATLALEILEDLECFDFALVPKSTGGLLTSMETVFNALRPAVKLLGCEGPAQEDPVFDEKSYAGLGIERSPAHALLEKSEYEVLRSSGRNVEDAGSFLLHEEKQWVERMGATALACMLENPGGFKNKKVVVVLTGGNRAFP